MSDSSIVCPENLTQEQQDLFWMNRAQELAIKAEEIGEVPVGALIVLDRQLIAEGYNQPISQHDPTAHAEVIALREAGEKIGNYRLLETTLYVTLEPCPMCASAMVHARVKRLVFGAFDQKTGAAGTVFDITRSEKLNHKVDVLGGVKEQQCREQLSAFFRQRREFHKQNKRNKES